MSLKQGLLTNENYLAIPNDEGGIGYFKACLVWEDGTTTKEFIPPDESGIQKIIEVDILNLTNPQLEPVITIIHDPAVGKEKLIITGPSSQIWLITIIGIPQQ